AIVAAQRNRVALNAAGVDDAAIPVLAEVGIAARANTVGVGGIRQGHVEGRVVPPGVPAGGRGVERGRNRGSARAVAPVAVGGITAAAGPDAPSDGASGETATGAIGKIRTGAKCHPLAEQHGVAGAVLNF